MTTQHDQSRPVPHWVNQRYQRPPDLARAWTGPVAGFDRNYSTAYELVRRRNLIALRAVAGNHARMSSRRADMFVDPTADPRAEPPTQAGERATLTGFLGWQRATLELKCAGLSAEELARRAVPPSTMSLLGLVRHLTEVERGWFRRFMAGELAPPYFNATVDGDFEAATADPEAVAQAWRLWRREVEFSDRFVAAAPDLDVTGAREDKHRGPMSLRWVLTHMIEEYARHNGHADLLRESIDGLVGE